MSRAERFAEFIKAEISRILRAEVSDPRIGFVSITDVVVSPDIKNAKIYVSILGSEKQKNDSMIGLSSATGFIRSRLAELLQIKSCPDLVFSFDSSIERGSKVLGILSSLKNEKKNIRPNKKKVKKR